MVFGDFKKLVKALKTLYPNENFLADEYAIKLWYKMLGDIPYEILNLAVQKYAFNNHFPPTVSDLRGIAVELVDKERMDWSEAWGEVVNAMREYGSYRGSEALASMNPQTAQAVKRMGWKDLCMSENLAVERANFRMIYEQVKSQREDNIRLPLSVQEKINQITGNEMKRLSERKETE